MSTKAISKIRNFPIISICSPMDISIRRRWAARMMSAAAEPIPLYGSAEWASLPEGSPVKVAAVVRAAECRAREGDDLEDNLRAEVDQLRRSHKAAEDAEYVARVQAHREQWRHLALQRVPASWREQPIPPRDLYAVGAEQRGAV